MESGTVWSEMTGTVWSEMGGTVWSVIAKVSATCACTPIVCRERDYSVFPVPFVPKPEKKQQNENAAFMQQLTPINVGGVNYLVGGTAYEGIMLFPKSLLAASLFSVRNAAFAPVPGLGGGEGEGEEGGGTGPVATLPELPDGACYAFYGRVATSGDRAVSFELSASFGITGVGGSFHAGVTGEFSTEPINAAPVGGPCRPPFCTSETQLNATVRVMFEGNLFIRGQIGATIPGFGTLPGGPGFAGRLAVRVYWEDFELCKIPC